MKNRSSISMANIKSQLNEVSITQSKVEISKTNNKVKKEFETADQHLDFTLDSYNPESTKNLV